jgi:putative DNA primase/helicase
MPTAADFFRRMYENANGTLVFCRKAEAGFARLACFDLPYQINDAIAFAADPKNSDCYFKYNLFDGASLRARGVNTIGSKRELSTLVAFGLDVDVSAKDSKYTDQQTARLLLDLMPLPPSAVIGSNGPSAGLHAYWFIHPLSIPSPEHYEYTRLVSRRWYRELARIAAPSKIDHTSGPERLLRPPGALRTSGQLVTVLDMPGYRYTLEQFTLPPDQHDQAGHAKQENEDSIILDYLHDVANIHSPEPIMLQAGWTSRRDDYTLWDRPESTSGAPTAQVYCSGDGRTGVTIKTPGLIRTLATDPITGERISSAVPDTPKWLNLQAFYTFMSQGGLTPDCWQRASKFARDRMPRGVEFDVVPQLPHLAPPRQRAAGRDQLAAARREIKDLVSASNRLLRMARAIVEIGLSDAQAWDILSEIDKTHPVKESFAGVIAPLTRDDLSEALRHMEFKTIRGCRSLPAQQLRSAIDPQELSLRILAKHWGWHYDDPTRCRLRWWREQWFQYNGRCWRPESDGDITLLLFKQATEVVNEKAQRMLAAYYYALDTCDPQKPPKQPVFPALSQNGFAQVLLHIKSEHAIGDNITLPYLQRESELFTKVHNPSNLVIFENGIGEIRDTDSRLMVGSISQLMPHDPRLFSLVQLPFAYDSSALCPRWLKFLNEVFGIENARDIGSENLLQEWFGLNLVHDITFHKILNVIGPPRSGKGTISRVLEMLLGEANVAHPRLDQLLNQFGLADLLNKQSIIVEDSRLGGSAGDRSKILSILLGISAGDKTSVGRKFKENVEQRLPGRITIFSNELANVHDPSGAFAKRLLLLQTRTSYFGREDLTLEHKLRHELPGIFNWALEGLGRLRLLGSFAEPTSTAALRQIATYVSSPITEFVDLFCTVGLRECCPKQELYDWYAAWGESQGRRRTSAAHFSSMLLAARPDLVSIRPEAKARRHWDGIGLKAKYREIDPRVYFSLPSKDEDKE